MNVIQNSRGRKSRISDEALLDAICRVIDQSSELGFCGEGYRKIWARLRLQGVFVDKERVRRVMRKNNLLAPCRRVHSGVSRKHDGTIIPNAPNVMWGTDATAAYTQDEGRVFVFAAIDHYTGECVGIHASRSGNRFEALEPMRQGVQEYFGGSAKAAASGLKLRHDNGSQYTSRDFQKELKFWDIESSPSFVRSPQGNGSIERFFRTLKTQLIWARYFKTAEELRLALVEFKEKFNSHWIMQRHGYKTPRQVREAWRLAMISEAA